MLKRSIGYAKETVIGSFESLYLRICANIQRAFHTLLGCFRHVFFYCAMGLYVISLAGASIGFNGNYALSVWAEGFSLMRSVVDGDYLNFTMQSEPFSLNEEETSADLTAFITNLNYYTHDGFALEVPSSQEGESTKGTITLFGESGPLSIDCGVVNMCNYRNETLGSRSFAAIRLSSLYSDWAHLDWYANDFEGKDASSYMSSALADAIIAADPNDAYADYDSLLGLPYTYSFNGHEYRFSLNNLYLSDGGYGPNLDVMFSTPIITDCASLYESTTVSIFSSYEADNLVYYELAYHLSEQTENGHYFTSYFVDKEGGVHFHPESDKIKETIASLYPNRSSLLIAGNNIPMFVIWIISLVSLFVLAFFYGRIHGASSFFDSILLCSALSLLLALISGIVFLSFGGGIVSYCVVNPVYGGTAILAPVLCCACSRIGRYTSDKKRKKLP